MQSTYSEYFSSETLNSTCLLATNSQVNLCIDNGQPRSCFHCNAMSLISQPVSPSWLGAMSTSQRAVTLCDCGVKADMVRVWVAGKTVWSPCYTQAISKRCRDKGLIIKRCKIHLFTLLLLLVFSISESLAEHIILLLCYTTFDFFFYQLILLTLW